MEFLRLFTHGKIYLLPDDTHVRALLYNMEGLMLEWVFESLDGVRMIGVLPGGQIVAYVAAGRDQFGLLYEQRPSDLTIEDLRAA